jgi:hypothetical protein
MSADAKSSGARGVGGPTITDRLYITEHKGKKIVVSDLSAIRSTLDLQQAVRIGSELVQSQPPKSVRILVNMTGVEYSLDFFAVVQQSVAVNRPFVKARAVIGLPAQALAPFAIVAKLSDSPMARFETVEEGMDWLATIE